MDKLERANKEKSQANALSATHRQSKTRYFPPLCGFRRIAASWPAGTNKPHALCGAGMPAFHP
ncbi:MAG: hypothetical protein ACK5OA_15665 [Acidovorax sp.]